jgi:IclR family pca regulon transcriptional regulator
MRERVGELSGESRALKRESTEPRERGGQVLPAAPFFGADAVPAETIRSFHGDADFVTGLARGLAVLLALSDRRRHMTIAQLARRTGIPRAATRRALHTLELLGFAASDDAHRFYLRPRVLSFSHAYLSASPLVVLAQPILDRLGESLREACSIASLDGDEIVYLARSASSRIMSPRLNVGRRLPAYCTSIGHVLLAHLPQAELDDYLARVRFFPYTEHTITSRERLLEVLGEVRENGFGFASQQMEPRLCTLAVPIQDAAGRYVAGLNVILHGRLLSASEMTVQFGRPLREAALELGSLLLA